MLNERLREKREEAGLTQAELARRIGVGRDLLNKYERTKTQPPYETLMLIARELNTPVAYFIDSSSPTPPGKEKELSRDEKVLFMRKIFDEAGVDPDKLAPEEWDNLRRLIKNNVDFIKRDYDEK